MKTSERLTELADFIKAKPPEQFDLQFILVQRDCGTVACVIGWHRHMVINGLVPSDRLFNIITVNEWTWLYIPSFYTNPTRHAALCRLRALARKYAAKGE